MQTPEPATSEAPLHAAANIRRGWRFYLGIVFFVLFLICPAFIPFVVLLPLSGGLQAALSALLAIGLPEVFAIVAVALMGRDSFDYLLRPIKRLLLRLAPPRTVSTTRHKLGLVMFAAPLIEAAIFLHSSEWRDLYAGWSLAGALIWDCLFVASFWVLGVDFWDKVRALFIHNAWAQFGIADAAGTQSSPDNNCSQAGAPTD